MKCYRTLTEPGARWISKPDNGGELHPSDVVEELNRLLRERNEALRAAEEAKEARNRIAQEVRAPLLVQLQRLRDRIEQLENRNAEQSFTVDRLRQAEADAQLSKWR